MDQILKIEKNNCQHQVRYVRVQPLLTFFSPISPHCSTKRARIFCWSDFFSKISWLCGFKWLMMTANPSQKVVSFFQKSRASSLHLEVICILVFVCNVSVMLPDGMEGCSEGELTLMAF